MLGTEDKLGSLLVSNIVDPGCFDAMAEQEPQGGSQVESQCGGLGS